MAILSLEAKAVSVTRWNYADVYTYGHVTLKAERRPLKDPQSTPNIFFAEHLRPWKGAPRAYAVPIQLNHVILHYEMTSQLISAVIIAFIFWGRSGTSDFGPNTSIPTPTQGQKLSIGETYIIC